MADYTLVLTADQALALAVETERVNEDRLIGFGPEAVLLSETEVLTMRVGQFLDSMYEAGIAHTVSTIRRMASSVPQEQIGVMLSTLASPAIRRALAAEYNLTV